MKGQLRVPRRGPTFGRAIERVWCVVRFNLGQGASASDSGEVCKRAVGGSIRRAEDNSYRDQFVSTQQAEALKVVRSKEVARTKLIEEVIRKTLQDIILQNVQTASTQGSVDEITPK